MRKLTTNDTPFLRKTLQWWSANFPFALEQAQLITWAEQFPDAVVDKGISVTAGWFERKKRASAQPSEQDAYRYATSCMRNIDRARATAEQLLGGAR